MNITQAVAAKLQGKKIDCRRCKYWVGFYPVTKMYPSNYCLKNKELKLDRTLCEHFKSSRRARFLIPIKDLNVAVSSNMNIKAVHEAHKEYRKLCEYLPSSSS
jgi:hypothetical protein